MGFSWTISGTGDKREFLEINFMGKLRVIKVSVRQTGKKGYGSRVQSCQIGKEVKKGEISSIKKNAEEREARSNRHSDWVEEVSKEKGGKPCSCPSRLEQQEIHNHAGFARKTEKTSMEHRGA